MNTFSAESCIAFGWQTFKKRPWFLIGAALLLIVVVGVLSDVCNELINQGGTAAFIGTLVRFFVQILAGMGIVSFGLKAHDDVEHVSIADLWRPRPFWKYVGAAFLFSLILVIGLILVIVPGIIWGIMFGYAMYFVIDKGLWPIEALKESRRITYGYKWQLFLLGILSILIVILGAICLLVGLLVAYPVVVLANVHAFRTLQQKAGPAPAV